MENENKVVPETTPETAQPVSNEPVSTTANPENVAPEVTQTAPVNAELQNTGVTEEALKAGEEMSKEEKTEAVENAVEVPTPEPTPTPTPAVEKKGEEVVAEIAEKLGGEAKAEVKAEDNVPVAKTPHMVDMNNLSKSQVQDLQELFSSTPRRKANEETYHTIELRQIEEKIIVEWGKTYFTLKHDPINRRDVMKTMIPVRFNGETDSVDVIWREEFMQAEKVTCKILKMEKNTIPEVVGECLKRDEDGGLTSQMVDMYVNRVDVILTVELPNGEALEINGQFAN